jgi:hypothetical protein
MSPEAGAADDSAISRRFSSAHGFGAVNRGAAAGDADRLGLPADGCARGAVPAGWAQIRATDSRTTNAELGTQARPPRACDAGGGECRPR